MQDILTAAKRFLHTDGVARRRDWLVIAAAIVAAWFSGSAVASGGKRALLAMFVGGLAIGSALLWALARTRLRRDFVAIELPALLILMAEVVFRQRDAESLATNPLDPAGLYRVACIGLALLLGSLALTSPTSPISGRITTRPFRLYCGYLLIVLIGAPLSVNLLLTTYRGVELLAVAVVAVGAFRRGGQVAGQRILTVVYWFTAASAVLIWVEALVMPSLAFTPVASPFPVQLHGVFPVVSSNSTGTIGAVLALWSIAKLLSPVDRGDTSTRILGLVTALGFLTLLFAQYRTGLIAATAGMLVLALLRSRAAGFWIAAAAMAVALVWGPQLIRVAEPIWQRGDNAEVLSNLTGRVNYWSGAVGVWRESPLFGRGLLTASRFEVLARMGSTYTSSIHGTWVEALVGTGLVGLALLAASYLISLARAFRESLHAGGTLVPIILLVFLGVRSITGATFEMAGGDSLVLLTIALLLRDLPSRQIREPALDGFPLREP